MPRCISNVTGYIGLYRAGTTILRGYISPRAPALTLAGNKQSIKFTYMPATVAGSPTELKYLGQTDRIVLAFTGTQFLSSTSTPLLQLISTSISTPSGGMPIADPISPNTYLESTV